MEEKTSVLIVDDNASLVKTISFVLRRQGYTVGTAQDGEQAIAMVKESHFDIVFMDIKVPLVDGIETYRRMKKIRPKVLVVMMTAHAAKKKVQEAIEEGIYDVICKPLKIEKVLALVEEVRQAKKETFILIVDNDPAICIVLKKILTRKGYKTNLVHSGEQAVEIVRRKAHDIILIEMKLPTINGLETCLKIQEVQPESAVILMTADRQEMLPLIETAMNNNAYACLYKPFAIEDLLKIVDEICEKKQRVISAEGRGK